MVNVGLNWSSIVGIALAVSGAGLYFLRTFRPNLARDHDIFFAAVALLCGGILFFQGWRQDPILQFGQFMLAASAIWFAYETIRLRGVATEQAKRATPMVDDERPVSRVYRAELDDLTPIDERPISRRIRGSRDSRSDDGWEESRRRPLTSRSSASDRMGTGSDRTRRRRPTDSSSRSEARDYDAYDGYGDQPDSRNAWNDEYGDVGSASSRRPSSRSSDSSSRSRRPRSSESQRDFSTDASSDYVDYQPIDYLDNDADNSSNFDR